MKNEENVTKTLESSLKSITDLIIELTKADLHSQTVTCLEAKKSLLEVVNFVMRQKQKSEDLSKTLDNYMP